MTAINRFLRNVSSLSTLSKTFSRRNGHSSAAALAHGSLMPPRKSPDERNVQWVFLGCPGVGKGTYASRLSKFIGVPHIATGDLVREELNASGPLAEKVFCILLEKRNSILYIVKIFGFFLCKNHVFYSLPPPSFFFMYFLFA